MRHSGKREKRGAKDQPMPDLSSFPFPDPRCWPREVGIWLRELKGKHGPWTIAIFDSGVFSCSYCEDAVAALSVLSACSFEWSVEGGYPRFVFASVETERYSRILGRAGYGVVVFEKGGAERAQERAQVIDISAGKERPRRGAAQA